MSIEEIYQLVDRYATLAFLNRLLTSKNTKSLEEFKTSVFDMDFMFLGLDIDAASTLGMNPDLKSLKIYQEEIVSLADRAAMEVFSWLSTQPVETKEAAKNYADDKVSEYLAMHSAEQDTYLEIVIKIDEATKMGDSNTLRVLSKVAKASYNRMSQYTTICQNYSNVSSYLNGMVRRNRPSK